MLIVFTFFIFFTFFINSHNMNCYFSGAFGFYWFRLYRVENFRAPSLSSHREKRSCHRGPRREFFFVRKSCLLEVAPGSPPPRVEDQTVTNAQHPLLLCWETLWQPSPRSRDRGLGPPSLPHRALLTEPSSQSPPRRAFLTEPSSQSLPHRRFLTEPSSQSPSHRALLTEEPSS